MGRYWDFVPEFGHLPSLSSQDEGKRQHHACLSTEHVYSSLGMMLQLRVLIPLVYLPAHNLIVFLFFAFLKHDLSM